MLNEILLKIDFLLDDIDELIEMEEDVWLKN